MAVFNVSGDGVGYLYGKNDSGLFASYDVNGNKIFKPNVDYDNYTVHASYLTASISNQQGFDVYDGYIFQFRAGGSGVAQKDRVAVIKMSDGSVVNQFAITADHGDSAYFSHKFYAESDPFPLIYVSADTSPYVYINRVTTSSATLIQTLKFDVSTVGYYANLAYDEDNEIGYMVGVTENSYDSDMGGTNKTIITKWDMSSLTDNGDGTYTPMYISSYQIPFIYVMQGIRFHDGMIWIPSGYYGGHESYLYVLDPSDGTALHTIDLNTTEEVEGTAFLSPTQMLVGYGGGRYDLYTFSTSE